MSVNRCRRCGRRSVEHCDPAPGLHVLVPAFFSHHVLLPVLGAVVVAVVVACVSWYRPMLAVNGLVHPLYQ